MRAAPLLLIALAALTFPAAVAARSEVIPTAAPAGPVAVATGGVGGPAVTGGRVLWSEPAPADTQSVYVSEDGGDRLLTQVPQRVKRPGDLGISRDRVVLDAGPERVAIGRGQVMQGGHGEGPYFGGSEVRVGPWTGPFATVATGCGFVGEAGCQALSPTECPVIVSVSGASLLSSAPPCTGGVSLLSPAPGGASQSLGTLVVDAAIAGPYVARVVLTNSFGAVRADLIDTRDGSTIFSDATNRAGVAVQEDGTMAYVSDGRVAWASPAEPSAHVLSSEIPYFADPGLSIAGGLIAYRGTSGPFTGPTVRVVDLAGTVRGSTDAPYGAGGDLDFDGARAAWAIAGSCGLAAIVVWDIADASAPKVPAGRCRAATGRTAALRPDKDGRLSIALDCSSPGAPSCAGKLRLVGEAKGGARYLLAQTSYRLPAGAPRSLEVPLSKGARTFLSRARKVTVTATSIADRVAGDRPRSDRGVATWRFRLGAPR